MAQNSESYSDQVQALSLLELNTLVAEVIADTLSMEYWVVAELADVKEWGGHCYMDLIQREEGANTPVAKASARCWSSRWAVVKPYFERVAGQRLASGMKLMLKVKASFHPNYGFAWTISDIDPTFTLGDMARKRLEIIRILKEEGIFDDNHSLTLPLFAQRIAVVSSATAAGYGDFSRQLNDNEYGYKFQSQLFAAVMQGEGVEKSVIEALTKINDHIEDFDCVVITRGGGATTDMSGFDSLNLARIVAQFELPVITAIGHDRDECVLDQIANVRVKTPTAAAAFLIDHLRQVDDRIEDARTRIIHSVQQRMMKENSRLTVTATKMSSLFAVVKVKGMSRIDILYSKIALAARERVSHARQKLENLAWNLQPLSQRKMVEEKHRVEIISQKLEALDPQVLLCRGYSITTHNGKAVTDADSLKPGDEIVTRIAGGRLASTLTTIEKNN